MLSPGYLVPLVLTLAAGLALVVSVEGRTGNGGRYRRLASRRQWIDSALLASITGIFTLTLNPQSEEVGASGMQLIPFREIINALTASDDLSLLVAAVANLLLFMPFGAALYMRGFSLKSTVLSGFLLTAGVEGAQLLFISGRTTSIDDLVLNTLGAALGHALLRRWIVIRTRSRWT